MTRREQGHEDSAPVTPEAEPDPRPERAVLRLRYTEELPRAEIAARMKRSVEGVHGLLQRGLARLRGILRRRGLACGGR